MCLKKLFDFGYELLENAKLNTFDGNKEFLDTLCIAYEVLNASDYERIYINNYNKLSIYNINLKKYNMLFLLKSYQ